MRIIFIRHGLTAGNLQKRYIGRTDEPLCEEGILSLRSKEYPQYEVLVCSPMRRCLQTAEIIFPHQDEQDASGLLMMSLENTVLHTQSALSFTVGP